MVQLSKGRGIVDVAVVGLGFGADFLPLYADHPDVGRVGIVDTSAERLDEVGNRHGIADRFTHLDEVLADDSWDAVHILAPVAFHAEYSLAVLRSGKHCACAVPMATELADLHEIVAAQQASGKTYMMMETSVYGREYLLAEQLYRQGRLGELTLYRGYHVQNLDGYPEYWRGYPPMKYITHALSPLLALTGLAVADVVAYGSGRLTPERVGAFGNPHPAEVGLFRLAGLDIVADVTMSFFQLARSYAEGFSIYGDERSLEWSGVPGEPMRLFELAPPASDAAARDVRTVRGRSCEESVVEPPDFASRLPAPLARYVGAYTLETCDGTPPVAKIAGHGGSHPYLVHEFVSSIVENRPPSVDAATSAAWTAPGICAHESALAGGERVDVPTFG
jgi:predicted dehydrogenase